MQNSLHLDDPSHQAALRRHFGSGDTLIVLTKGLRDKNAGKVSKRER